MSKLPNHLSAETIQAMPEVESRHQFNSNAVRHTRTLSDATGMTRLGVHLVRLQPGRESTQFHTHDNDEEFIFVLSGTGTARIGEQQITVSAGDYMGFPCEGDAHTLINTGSEDLLYLMGGERNANDVVHYPDIEKSLIKTAGRRLAADWQSLESQPPKKG